MAIKTKKKKAKTGAAVVNVGFIWDMSGSMSSVHAATVAGTTQYLNELQEQERTLIGENGNNVYTRFSLTIFDTEFEHWITDEPVADIDAARLQRYQPRGMTALYDAIAHTVLEMDRRVKDREGEKNLVVIMTDGLENSSREYDKKKILDLVERFQAKGNWTFVYLGANVDAYAEAQNIGIPVGNAAHYSSSPGSVAMASASYGSMTSSLRSSPAASSDSAFADAGLSQDYRDDPSGTSAPDFSKDPYGNSSDALKAARKLHNDG